MYHYYMFHKPYGCVSARSDDRFLTVMDYFKELNNPNLSPVGRLDRETEGLLFITDDGAWNQMMTHPDYKKEKVYEFIALGTLDEEKKMRLENGILLRGSEKLTRPCKIELNKVCCLKDLMDDLPKEIQNHTKHNRPEHPGFYGKIILSEGRKRQIRRMFKEEKCLILYLKRVAMAGYELDGDLKPGEWKEIEIRRDDQ